MKVSIYESHYSAFSRDESNPRNWELNLPLIPSIGDMIEVGDTGESWTVKTVTWILNDDQTKIDEVILKVD